MTTQATIARGTLFVVSAPSGAGKSTLVRALVGSEPRLRLSVSHTSRPPRPGERDGVDYHFVSRQHFMDMVAAGDFFEYAEVHGDMKGTSVKGVDPILDAGDDVLLEIDCQGAAQVRQRVPDSCTIFILPPSRAELERRLRTRATDSDAAIARRLADSHGEIAHAHDFDFIVVNDDFDTALGQLRAIVQSARLRTSRQSVRCRAIMADLLDH